MVKDISFAFDGGDHEHGRREDARDGAWEVEVDRRVEEAQVDCQAEAEREMEG